MLNAQISVENYKLSYLYKIHPISFNLEYEIAQETGDILTKCSDIWQMWAEKHKVDEKMGKDYLKVIP